MSKKPVVFLTFANSYDAPLALLKQESQVIFNELFPMKKKGNIELFREESADNQTIINYLSQYNDQVVIFHYGGHANSEGVFFEGGGGFVHGLADILQQQKNLQLVFINGCSSKNQAAIYLEHGAKAVIATSFPIEDSNACLFAKWFYHKIALNSTIKEAYEFAAGVLKSENKQFTEDSKIITYHRGLRLRRDKQEELPWQLYVNETNKTEVLNWKLSKSWEKDWKETAKKLIARKKIKEAFKVIRTEVDEEDEETGFILLLIQYNNLVKNETFGLENNEDILRGYTRLGVKLLQFIKKLDEDDDDLLF